MGIDAIGGSAAAGLAAQARRLEASAERVAQVAPVEPPAEPAQQEDPGQAAVERPAQPEPYTVDLVREQTVQIESAAHFQANLASLETADELERELLDVEA